MRVREPSEGSWRRRFGARAEFDAFRLQAKAAILRAAEDMPDLRVLRDH